MNDTALQGLAKIIREESTSPSSSTRDISLFEAQSKPVPSAASKRSTYGSGLHFTAKDGYSSGKYAVSSEIKDTYHRKVLFQEGISSNAHVA